MSENESEFKIGNNIIQKVNKYKYLGVELNYCLNFTETVNTLATASSRSLGSLVHKYYSSNGLYSNTYKTLYDAMVCKIMDYGSAVWGGPLYSKCDTVQQRAMRTILGVGNIINSPDYRLPKRIFALDTTQWKKGLRLMFTGAKLINVFDTNNTQGLSFTHIFDRIKNYLMSMYREKMCKSVEKMLRLANYKDFDSVLEIEEKMYVNSCKNRNNVSIIAKFRSSTFSKLKREESGILKKV